MSQKKSRVILLATVRTVASKTATSEDIKLTLEL